MNKEILKLVVSILLSTILFSCEKDKVEETSSVEWTKYSTFHGLKDDNIHAIAVDISDNIWVGTDRGISKYDGAKFTNYQPYISNPKTAAIAIDSNGDKWIGTFGEGAAKFDGENWEYFKHDSKSSNSIASNYIRSITIDSEGNKWFGTGAEGVSKFDGANWTHYTSEDGLADNTVYVITIDAQQNRWFGTNGGASKFDGNTWTTYSYTGDKTTGIAGNGVFGIVMDNENNMWFATFGGLSKFDGTNWTHYGTETEWLEAQSPVLSVGIDSKGSKWFGSNGWGVSKFDGVEWTTYKEINYAKISPVNAIAIDKKGNKWFGTDSGLLKLKD